MNRKSIAQDKKNIIDYMDKVAPLREKWIKRNQGYYKDLVKFLKFVIPENSKVLEIGCGTGWLLEKLKPGYGMGVDFSEGMLAIAKKQRPKLKFILNDAEALTIKEKFDYIVISDTLGYLVDIQKAFKCLAQVSTPNTRIIITHHNFLWSPLLALAETLGMKMPRTQLNWLNQEDLKKLLHLEGYEIIKQGRRLLLPMGIPVISWLCNKYLAHWPIINRLCLTGFIIARPQPKPAKNENSVSVIIPARNERGNIENAITRLPRMGRSMEIIFVEGHSTDGTQQEIRRVCKKYAKTHKIKYLTQDGKGKADAVRKGFAQAQGDILMILDADLTVPPEDLPKFYNAMVIGKGEFINGSRLVYPLAEEAMRFLNIIGNKFFSMAFSWLLGQSIKDTLCGTKAIRRENYIKLVNNRAYFGDFDPFGDFDLIFGAAKLNLKIVEIPIRYQAREYGDTSISRFRHGWLLLQMVFFAMNKIKFI